MLRKKLSMVLFITCVTLNAGFLTPTHAPSQLPDPLQVCYKVWPPLRTVTKTNRNQKFKLKQIARKDENVNKVEFSTICCDIWRITLLNGCNCSTWSSILWLVWHSSCQSWSFGVTYHWNPFLCHKHCQRPLIPTLERDVLYGQPLYV